MIVAYRTWKPVANNDGKLRLSSLLNEFIWESPVVECDPPRKIHNIELEVHQSVDIDPSLGFYSFKKYDDMCDELFEADLSGMIKGAIQIFGRVRVHEYGYRSQKAQILAISNSIGCEYVVNRNDFYDAETCGKDAHFFYGQAFFCSHHLDLLKSATYYYNYNNEILLSYLLRKISDFYQCEILSDEEIMEIQENGYR